MNSKNKFFRFSMYLIASILIFATSCKKDTPEPVIDHYKVMTEYMVANSMDLPDVITSWTISATDLNAALTNYYIIDLRSSTDFAAGHIDGAHNTTLANVLTEAANANGKPIVTVCYTGQTAAHAHVALRLSGYSDCKILLFGMSSWNDDFDMWTANVGDVAVGNTNWSTTNTIQSPVVFSTPEITSTETTGEEILKERVNVMLAGGFQGITNDLVLTTPADYFINNYWTTTDIDTYGHIKTAYRIKEDLSLASDGFKYLDKDAVDSVTSVIGFKMNPDKT